MKRIAAMGLLLLLAGCNDATQTNENAASPANTADASAAGEADILVTDFKSPELAGLAVRDHPQGVQVANSPTARGTTPPPIGTNDLLWALDRGAIFTSVNDTPVRDAKHFRDLMNALDMSKDVRLGQTLFLEDAGDGQVMIRTTPPEGR